MAKEMLTLETFEEASEIVSKVTRETKLIYSEFFSNVTGNKVYLKPENMQLTGAYKVRGAYYTISTLSDEERAKGLITASAGNHAQGVAYAAKAYGAKAVIVMPTTTPLIKVNRTKGYGAEVILYGDVYDEACARALELAKDKGYTFPTVMDQNADLLRSYYITAFPTTFIIDDEGNVLGYIPGAMTEDIMEDVIRQAREIVTAKR